MLETNTSFAPFVAEDDEDVVDPGIMPSGGLSDEDLVEEDEEDASGGLDMDSDEDEEEEEWEEAA